MQNIDIYAMHSHCAEVKCTSDSTHTHPVLSMMQLTHPCCWSRKYLDWGSSNIRGSTNLHRSCDLSGAFCFSQEAPAMLQIS
jgi:hypothetical protein